MSIYDKRDTPAYGAMDIPASYSRNKHVRKWWGSEHDRLIKDKINEGQWTWYWEITDAICAITPEETIAAWRRSDPLCQRYAWYNVLMFFAISRAQARRMTKSIREPLCRTCPLCGHRFVEDSLPAPLVRGLGIDHLEYCAPCLKHALFEGDDRMGKHGVETYLRKLSDTIGRVPPQGFGDSASDLRFIELPARQDLLEVLSTKPTVKRVRSLYGSWLAALIAAGVLEDGTRRTSRGTQCMANDGHVCLSLGEKTIDDILSRHSVQHEKEPRYPEGNYRADFAVGAVLIEYFGLKGNKDYDAKTRLKQRICRKHGIRLISLYPSDLASSKKLRNKLSTVIADQPNAP